MINRRDFLFYASIAAAASRVVVNGLKSYKMIVDIRRDRIADTLPLGTGAERSEAFLEATFGKNDFLPISGYSGTSNPRAIRKGEKGYAISIVEDELIRTLADRSAIEVEFLDLTDLQDDHNWVLVGGPVANEIVRGLHGYDFDPKTGVLVPKSSSLPFQFASFDTVGSNPVYGIQSAANKSFIPRVEVNSIVRDYLMLTMSANTYAPRGSSARALTISGAKSLGTYAAAELLRDVRLLEKVIEAKGGSEAREWQIILEVIGEVHFASSSPRIDTVEVVGFESI